MITFSAKTKSFTIAALLLAAPALHANDAAVLLDHDADAGVVKVTIRGEHFTTYHYNGDRHMPYLWPVHAEGGVGITRNFPMGKDEPAIEDHPHHLSIYLTHGAVNGHDFWHADRKQTGVIRTMDLQTGSTDGHAWIRTKNHWVTKDDAKIVMEETREIRFHDTPASARVFDWITTFHATNGDVTLGDTKEAMLAVRVRPEIDGQHGGMLTNADGRQGEANVYGTPSRWMDFSGVVAGHGTRGIAVFDHPENFRAGYWHVRDYGLLSINPSGRQAVFRGEDGAHTIPNGESLTLRYRLVVHSGTAEEADLEGLYAKYLEDETLKTPAR